NDERHSRRIITLLHQVDLEVANALDVRVERSVLAVYDEHDAIGVAKDEPTRLVVTNLAGDGAEVEADRVIPVSTEINGQKIEEERSLRLRRQRQELAPVLGSAVLMDPLEIRRLSPEPRPVIHELEVELPESVLDDGHRLVPILPQIAWSCPILVPLDLRLIL